MPVRDLSDGCAVETALVVRDVRAVGSSRLVVRLADRTGSIPAVVAAELGAPCEIGAVVVVCGRAVADPRFGLQVIVESVREAVDGEFDPAALRDGPARPLALLESDLRELEATIQRPCLRALLAGLLGEGGELWERFRVAPAAKHYHQAYRGGLLEHSLTVAQAVSAISATFPGIDRDVAVTGALLHDIGKLDAYASRGEAIEMSDGGRLFGEIPLGYFRVRSAIEAIDDFPGDVADALLHIVLSHHGSLEHGSPVVPATREAALVHGVDTLGAKLGSYDRVEKSLPPGECWSGYDKALGGGAYFPPGSAASEPPPSASPSASASVARAARAA